MNEDMYDSDDEIPVKDLRKFGERTRGTNPMYDPDSGCAPRNPDEFLIGRDCPE